MFWQIWREIPFTSLISTVNIVTLAVVIVVCYFIHEYRRLRNFNNIPPGPKPWPLVGNFGGFLVPSFISKRFGRNRESVKRTSNPVSPQVGLMELSKIYGNIFSIFVGSQLMVLLTGYEVVRDALSNHAEVFSDRPDVPVITIMTKRKGKVHALCELNNNGSLLLDVQYTYIFTCSVLIISVYIILSPEKCLTISK